MSCSGCRSFVSSNKSLEDSLSVLMSDRQRQRESGSKQTSGQLDMMGRLPRSKAECRSVSRIARDSANLGGEN